MVTAASVLVCALSVLGRSERSLPPIELIEVAPPDVSTGAEAFVRQETRTIYLITSSAVFRDAMASPRRCDDSLATKKLASIIAHEEWHLKKGPDEQEAYQMQLITLLRMGIEPGSPLYREVQRSMLRVVELRKRNRPVGILAER